MMPYTTSPLQIGHAPFIAAAVDGIYITNVFLFSDWVKNVTAAGLKCCYHMTSNYETYMTKLYSVKGYFA